VHVPGLKPLLADAPCALCGSLAGLELSHLVPKFVFRHASVRAPTGYLRTTLAPNVRYQDGPKEYLLCRSCEGHFSKWENSFAKIFKAHNAQPGQNFVYRTEDALCALSILWRVLAHGRQHPELNHLEFGSDYSRTDAAFEVWQKVLLTPGTHRGKFRIFWLFFDYVSAGHPLGEGINRYIFHATDFDVIASKHHSFAYAHMPGVFLVGALESVDRSSFRGFDVSFQGGFYRANENKIAPQFLFNLIREKNEAKLSAADKISPAQQKRIRDDALKNPERALASLLFRTHLHDSG
jgi:hypothetical protein